MNLPSSHVESVLVVEDHPELQDTIRELLPQAGYDVRCASTVDEALTILNDMPAPCLVLWDPVLLQINGLLSAHSALRGVHVATIPVERQASPQARKLLTFTVKAAIY